MQAKARSILVQLVAMCVCWQQVAGFYSDGVDPECLSVPEDVTLCHNVLWTHTKLPNWLGDETMSELRRTSYEWAPLIYNATLCHRWAREFLCSLITPICTAASPEIRAFKVAPCRVFCEEVQLQCEPLFRSMGSQWPMQFRCSQFDNTMCYSPNETIHNAVKPAATPSDDCKMCSMKTSRVKLLEHFCVSSMVAYGQIRAKWQLTLHKNLSKAIKYGRDLAVEMSIITIARRAILNVTGLCDCRNLNSTGYGQRRTAPPRVGGKKVSAYPLYIVFIDKTPYYEELLANMVIPVKKLTAEQLKDWKKIMKGTVSCSSRKVPGNNQRKTTRKLNGKRNNKHVTLKRSTVKKTTSSLLMTTSSKLRVRSTGRPRSKKQQE